MNMPRKRGFLCTLMRFVRHPRHWVQSQLISSDGQMIYTIRDREGDERQVLNNKCGWEPVSAARFSLLPCFEDYHRHKLETAVRYTPNDPAHRTPGAKTTKEDRP